MAVALQVAELAFIRIDVLHPELCSIWMRCISADRLNVNASNNARLWNHGFNFRIALKRIAVGESVVIPADDDWGRALCQRSGLADDRNEVAIGIEFLVEFKALLASFYTWFRTACDTCSVNTEDCLSGNAWITSESNRIGIIALEQVFPILWDVLNDVLIHFESENTVIVAIPVSFSILGAIRNFVPGCNLVRLDQTVFLGGGAESKADVNNVRSLWTLVILVGLDGFDFVARTRIWVQFVDLETILVFEALDDFAVAAPIMRESDGGQFAFGLRRSDQFGRWFSSSNRNPTNGDCRRKRQQTRSKCKHCLTPLLKSGERSRSIPVFAHSR